jgi:chromate transporter
LAFKQGLAPIVIGAILATSWIISATNSQFSTDWALWLVTGVTVLLIWKTKIHILLLLLVGTILGALGWI